MDFALPLRDKNLALLLGKPTYAHMGWSFLTGRRHLLPAAVQSPYDVGNMLYCSGAEHGIYIDVRGHSITQPPAQVAEASAEMPSDQE